MLSLLLLQEPTMLLAHRVHQWVHWTEILDLAANHYFCIRVTDDNNFTTHPRLEIKPPSQWQMQRARFRNPQADV